MLSVSQTTYPELHVEWKSGKDVEGSSQLPIGHLPARTKENHKNLIQDSL
jgi:hypothetical protein